MVLLGILLLILGLIVGPPILVTLGVILIVLGVILNVVPIGGSRRRWY